ncbi:MAG: hypothetical protein N2314_03190, partial [Brevinematales bacterium]|nr:hypothetical protein [Brevinematales bacterium]
TTVPHYSGIFKDNPSLVLFNFVSELPISMDGNNEYIALMFTNRVEIRDYAYNLLQVISNTFSDNNPAEVPMLLLDKGYLLIRRGNMLWIYK